jgi:hypothetical protein
LWSKYNELIPQVQQQLKAFTREVAQGKKKTDLDTYISMMESELKKAESGVEEVQRNTGSDDPAAFAYLGMKIHSLQQAKITLGALQERLILTS